MRLWPKLTKMTALRGATVVGFECDDCMGTDHAYRWVGTVERFELRGLHQVAVIKIHKRDEHSDSRDKDLGSELVIVEDNRLQKISDKLFFQFL